MKTRASRAPLAEIATLSALNSNFRKVPCGHTSSCLNAVCPINVMDDVYESHASRVVLRS